MADEKTLLAAAKDARKFSHSPFSNFAVGAALETESGEIITGCNIENSTFGLTMCAERTAIYKAVSEGKRNFTRIAICADTSRLTPPCGSCRQIIWEFCGNIPVILENLNGQTEQWMMKDLLPDAFDSEFLK